MNNSLPRLCFKFRNLVTFWEDHVIAHQPRKRGSALIQIPLVKNAQAEPGERRAKGKPRSAFLGPLFTAVLDVDLLEGLVEGLKAG